MLVGYKILLQFSLKNQAVSSVEVSVCTLLLFWWSLHSGDRAVSVLCTLYGATAWLIGIVRVHSHTQPGWFVRGGVFLFMMSHSSEPRRRRGIWAWNSWAVAESSWNRGWHLDISTDEEGSFHNDIYKTLLDPIWDIMGWLMMGLWLRFGFRGGHWLEYCPSL